MDRTSLRHRCTRFLSSPLAAEKGTRSVFALKKVLLLPRQARTFAKTRLLFNVSVRLLALALPSNDHNGTSCWLVAATARSKSTAKVENSRAIIGRPTTFQSLSKPSMPCLLLMTATMRIRSMQLGAVSWERTATEVCPKHLRCNWRSYNSLNAGQCANTAPKPVTKPEAATAIAKSVGPAAPSNCKCMGCPPPLPQLRRTPTSARPPTPMAESASESAFYATCRPA